MDFQARKLLSIQENDPTLPASQSVISSNTTNQEHYTLSSYRTNPPFDSSMALTILLLLTALFFMEFFTIYMRRSSEDYRSSEKQGLDRNTLESMPVHRYDDSGSKEMNVDCAICLSEFEKGEFVKAIPFCGHVFHVGCIDAWLDSHVTCPLCRSPKLFPDMEELTTQCDACGREAVG